MRRFPLLSRLLIAFGFLAVQAMAVVHATSHELKAESSAACEVCALAHAAGAAPATLDTAGLQLPQSIERVQPPLAAATSTLCALPPSRGPPSILA
jgi:hypothetical protein